MHRTPIETGSFQDTSIQQTDEVFNPVRAETALWTAVITQALMDAGCESKKPEAQHDKAKAIRWLTGFSDDFITVCLNAGLDPEYVCQQSKKALARGCAWRRGLYEQRIQKRAYYAQLETKSSIALHPTKRHHFKRPSLTMALPYKNPPQYSAVRSAA